MYKFLDAKIESFWGENHLNDGGFRISWAAEGIGFGELTFFRDKEGNLMCDDEYMGIEFVNSLLRHVVKGVKLKR